MRPSTTPPNNDPTVPHSVRRMGSRFLYTLQGQMNRNAERLARPLTDEEMEFMQAVENEINLREEIADTIDNLEAY